MPTSRCLFTVAVSHFFLLLTVYYLTLSNGAYSNACHSLLPLAMTNTIDLHNNRLIIPITSVLEVLIPSVVQLKYYILLESNIPLSSLTPPVPKMLSNSIPLFEKYSSAWSAGPQYNHPLSWTSAYTHILVKPSKAKTAIYISGFR